MAELQKISSKARREIYIKDEEKQFNITSHFGYIHYPSISHSGLPFSFFDGGLDRLSYACTSFDLIL